MSIGCNPIPETACITVVSKKLAEEVALCMFHLPPCPGKKKKIVFAFLYSVQQCGPRFWCQSEVGGWEGQRGRCEHIAEECGCGLLPKAYAILMFPWVREGKMRLDGWGRVRTKLQWGQSYMPLSSYSSLHLRVFTFSPQFQAIFLVPAYWIQNNELEKIQKCSILISGRKKKKTP